MRKAFVQLLLLTYAVSFPFGFLKAQKQVEQKVVSGAVLLNSKTAPDSKLLLNALKTNWKLKVDSATVAEKTLVFNSTGGTTVMVAYLEYPAALDEIGAAARLSWLWKTGYGECSKHQAQVVISVIGPGNRSLDLYKIFTQTAAAVLEVTRAPGIFLGSQYLLLSADYFTSAARNMVQNQTIPLYCWVYFGRPGDGNGFTYGLSEFGLPEMEIVNSARPETEVHSTLYDATMSVVKYGTRVQDGQSITTEEGVKLLARFGKAQHVEGQEVLRLEY